MSSILPRILIPVIWLLFSPAATFCLSNAYNLTMEDELSLTETQGAINRYWENGKQGSFIGTDGIRIRYRHMIGEGEKGDIVIVNGWGETYLKYRETAYDLYRHGYSVYVYDHRGQGLSGRMLDNPQIGHVRDFNNYIEDLRTFYRQVVAQHEEGNLYLLAHSMGGAIATLYLERYPDDFHAAALCSPMMEINTGVVSTAVSCKVAEWLRELRQRIEWQPDFVPFTGPYDKRPFSENRLTHSRIRYELFTSIYEERPGVQVGGPSYAWVNESCRAGRQARQEAGRINIPILVLQAGEDRLVTAEGQRIFCDNLAAGGRSQCFGGGPYPVNDGYHELLMEKDEYRIPTLTAIMNFFEAH